MGFPPLLNSLLSFFRGCRAWAFPQRRFAAFAPANKGALRAQSRSRVPSAAQLLYHGKHNGFHPMGAGWRRLSPSRARCYARIDRFGQAASVLPSYRPNLYANRAPATAPVFFGAVLVRNRNGAAVPASGLRIREKG